MSICETISRSTDDHLYLTLPSSASMDLHPENKISDFNTEILNPITFEREMCEAGLSEIILDASIENVTLTRGAFIIYRSVDFVKNTLKLRNTDSLHMQKRNGIEYYVERFTIKRGLYNSLLDILRHFNNRFIASWICQDLIFRTNKPKGEIMELVSLRSWRGANLHDLNNFQFDPYTWWRKGFRLTDNPSEEEVNHNHDSSNFIRLVFHYLPTIDDYIASWKTTFANSFHFVCNPAELLQDPGMAYVYTDIIDHQYVGNTKASLLRVVHFPKDCRVITFPYVHYLPLSKTQLTSIRIYIRDVEGNPYPFTIETVVCKVHIRRKLR